ncbi:MAG: tyrosine--tRNA ligase [Candidatus Staskawiczbacteria bacterium RIFOXYD1_FULL_39_28]|uniref:Tyrosine--tRNA ligase n=1 Tax=Candidatus Staskawiczbacteria bacterium RIFOXYC1_FULL_38_18 TaxID=1802229 RepID=A0A1G2JC37_9BACT|nr:MAG: tyrosine--tRNA ligase [Candidatus Staskawiczbacteria bacterium RIFOXYC1_FULL_38_18]OGZ91511.1 MAG: tyrosine--tRNA ligase [Candidatus Staskawiczbacteria bacterium RIFOXYD1_FULL_39_28]
MIETNPQKIEEILTRGVEEIIVKDDLKKRLLSGKKIKLYFGVDPTGADLHIGHAVQLWKLRDFQELGHDVILLIGDFTARIGDPSGKDALRKPLSEKEVKENFKTYKKQASKILNFSKVKIQYNSSWLSKLKFADILKLASNFTVQQMIQREMFQKRLSANMPISLQEFMYPLMQGYDSVAMDVDLEIGGNDQMFNMLAGRTLQKIYNNKDKSILTTKLLLGSDGRKMSKTYNNFVAIEDAPNDMFGKIMSMSDNLIDEYLELATRLSVEEIKETKKLSNPRDQKARLAREIVKMYHEEKEAVKAEEEFNKIFRNKELPSDMPIFEVTENNYAILDLMLDAKLAVSKNEAKRLVEQNAVEIIIGDKKQKIIDWKAEVNIEDGMIIKVGNRRFVKIIKK